MLNIMCKNWLAPKCWQTEFMSFNQEQETVLKSGNNENIMKVDSLRA